MTAQRPEEVARRMYDAAVGAGWHKTTAIEIGNAAAWLCAQGVDGVTPALAAMSADPVPLDDLARPDGEGGWRIDPAPVAIAGPAALDLVLDGRGPTAFVPGDETMILLGFVGHASARTGLQISLSGAINARFKAGRLIGAPQFDSHFDTVTLALAAGGQPASGTLECHAADTRPTTAARPGQVKPEHRANPMERDND